MRHGEGEPITDPAWMLEDDPDLMLVYADMHAWSEANEQDEDDPIEE